MTRRQKLMAFSVLLVLAGGIVVGLVLLQGNDSSKPSASASPVATPLVSAEVQKQVEGYAREFVERYYNYQRPDDPTYLESFKSYVSESLYQNLVADNRKASKFPNIPTLSSSIQKVTVTVVDQQSLNIAATIESTPSGGSARQETVLMTWKSPSGRWQITELHTGKKST